MHLAPLTIALLAFVFLFDTQNAWARWRRRTLTPTAQGCDDFTIIVPIYGDPAFFADRQHMARYQSRCLVTADVSTPVMRKFVRQLRDEGWTVYATKQDKPTVASLVRGALEAGKVKTTYTVRLDADTVIPPGLERAVEAMRLDGADACSLRCRAFRPQSLCERMQDQEYRNSMESRRHSPWLFSGASHIVKTNLMKEILRRHTCWPQSEDFENGRIARQLKARIRHIDFTVYTVVPPTWRALWRQRSRGWWVGNFQHHWANFDHNALLTPISSFYFVAVVGIGWALNIWSFTRMSEPSFDLAFFASLFLIYTAMIYFANWRVRSRYLLLMPYYSLFQSILMTPVGFVNYLRFVKRQGDWGRYRFGYQRRRLPARIYRPKGQRLEGAAARAEAVDLKPQPSA